LNLHDGKVDDLLAVHQVVELRGEHRLLEVVAVGDDEAEALALARIRLLPDLLHVHHLQRDGEVHAAVAVHQRAQRAARERRAVVGHV